jgi:hypothetical protein
MIEMVIALAIGSGIVVAVYSTTQALSGVARRQEAASSEDARWQRFVEVLRRDVRGWVTTKETASTRQAELPGEDKVLLRFPTTADGLASEALAGEKESPSRSVSTLQYLVRYSSRGFEITRLESNAGGATLELGLYRSAEAPKIEFLSGSQWVAAWTGRGRPDAVRLTVAKRSVFVGL